MEVSGFAIEMFYPSPEEVKKCLSNNADLLGSVEVVCEGGRRRSVLPLPYKGVFVVRNFEQAKPDLLVWSPFMGKAGARAEREREPSGEWIYTFKRYLDDEIRRRIDKVRGKVSNADLDGLIPIRMLRKSGLLTVVRPQNPLELLAAINGVRRYNVPRRIAMRYGADKRRNIPSFNGRICPIETPESELIGIQLQLARAAQVREDGYVVPAVGNAPIIDKLGWGASLIPFVNFNDSARNTVGAKNLRQALVLEGREAPYVKTGVENVLVERMRPLMDVGLCPSALDAEGELALGCNLKVAYMPWFGWNIEDAIVVSESTARRMSARGRNGKVLPLKLGDKLTGRHGNKGVVSKIEPDERMPKLPDGTHVDAILNPHGIISRMNPGQLLETHLGWLYQHGVKESDVMDGDKPNHRKIRELLMKHGLDDRGRTVVTFPDGKQTENPVVVGFQYFVRLNHIPSEKSHADRKQRLGEMEVWALAAHKADAFLKEKLGGGFEKLLKDWLLVLGIGFERTLGGVEFKRLDDDGLLEAMMLRDPHCNPLPPQEVTATADMAGYEETFCADYGCKENGCNYQVDRVYAGGSKTLKMSDLLRGLGIFCKPELEIMEGKGRSASSKVYKAVCSLLDGRRFWGYYQKRSGKDGVPTASDFNVTCPRHSTTPLTRIGEMRGRKFLAKPKGLFDPEIFGNGRWGYIRLQEPLDGRSIVPVLPLEYRKPLVEGMVDEISEAYADLMRARRGTSAAREMAFLKSLIKRRLFGVVEDGRKNVTESSKRGFVRRQGLGRDVDHAARQVIVPNPELNWDEVGVPRAVYHALTGGAVLSREDLLVLNRQPTLHKYGMQTLRPRLMEGDEHVFQISPLVCGAFAADFDGDEMVAHYPVSDAAQEDARKMLPENNLISDANGKPTVHFKLDFRSGAYLLGKGETAIREISEKSGPKAVGELTELAKDSFEAITRDGASFGFYDFIDKKSGKGSAALKLIFDDAKANGNPKQMEEILERLIEGMDWDALFEQSDDGRRRLCAKKLNSAKAGGLTRRLVLELWLKRDTEGLMAAQSIGERGLQLTQSAVHGGGFDVDEARRVFMCHGKKLDRERLPAAYKELRPEILDIWDDVFADEEVDWNTVDAFARLARGKDQFEVIEELADSGKEVKFGSPFGKVFFNEF